MVNREIPQNIEAEQSVIGAMLLSKSAIVEVIESLVPESFYLDKHGKLFTAIKKLYDNGIPVDFTTLTNELKDQGLLSAVGGVEYITEIMEQTPIASNVSYYINIVEEKSVLRRLIDSATDIASLGYSNEYNLEETLDKAESKILEVVKDRKATDFKHMPEVLTNVQTNLEKLAANKGKISGLSSGYIDIDKLTDGFHPGELIILAARPSVGKTALALNIAQNVAINDKKSVIIFTLEMLAEQVVPRMIASVGQIEAFKLKNGNLENKDWSRVTSAMATLADTNIYIADTTNITVGDIKAKSRRVKAQDPNLALIVIDYLTLISGMSRYSGQRQQEVSEISRALKALALELQIPILALAQLSRALEAREDKRPILSDLRESGQIEQDADIVAFLYRDDYHNKEVSTPDNISKIEVILRKNRNGSTGTAELLFKKNTQSFMNYTNDIKEVGDKSE
jgi:replicative DNA helicase